MCFQGRVLKRTELYEERTSDLLGAPLQYSAEPWSTHVHRKVLKERKTASGRTRGQDRLVTL